MLTYADAIAAHMAAAACVLPLVPLLVLYADTLKSKLSFVVDGLSPAKKSDDKRD